MKTLLAAALLLLACPPPAARAADGCTAVFLRDSPAWTFGARRPALVRKGTTMPRGSRAAVNGISRIGAKLWVYEANSDRMFDRSDLSIPAGCTLMTLDTSEPD